MQTTTNDFTHYANELLEELAQTACKLDLGLLAYILQMAALEAADQHKTGFQESKNKSPVALLR